MMKALRIATGLNLPIDAVTQKIAWLGRTGSGKTFGCKRFVEQMLHANAQVVILDGSGAWAGLRLGKKSFQIPVFGGLYGDIPLEPTGGALVADVIVDRRTSMVLDVSQMRDAERTRFSTTFAERFFFRKKSSPSAVHLVLEECQDFVPENQQRGEEQMLHEFQRLAKQGRPHGIGMSFISQRPQEISKKALNQAECVFAFQMNGPHERKALQYWLNDKGAEEKLEDILPRLEVGAPHVWSPQWLKVSKVVHILPIESLDTSRTPKVGDKKFKRKALRPIDLKGLEKEMAATIERSKAEDPKELQRRIVELEKELKKKTPSAVVSKGTGLKEGEVAVRRDHLEHIVERVTTFEKELEEHAAAAMTMEKATRHILIAANGTAAVVRRACSTGSDVPAKRLAKAPLTPKPDAVEKIPAKFALDRKTNGVSNGAHGNTPVLSVGQRLVLSALAQHGSCERAQLRTLTSYRTSTINRLLSELAAKGLSARNGRTISPTEAGVAALGSDYEPLPTGDALFQHWIGKATEGQRTYLGLLLDAYPNSVSRADLAAGANYATSTGNRLISELRAMRVCTTSSDGVRLAEELVG